MSRSQKAETRSNRSNCRIRNSSSKHLEIVRDVKEDFALHCLGLRHIPQIDFGKCRQGGYIRVLPRKHHESRRRTFPLHGTHDKSLQSIMKCDDETRKDLHDGVMMFNGTDALQGIGERMTKDRNAT